MTSTEQDIRRIEGRWLMSRSAFESRARHGYAGRKDGECWTLYPCEAGTCLIPDVVVVSDAEFGRRVVPELGE